MRPAYREIDIHPSLAALLREHIGNRTSGFVFQGRDGQAIVSQSSILKRSLHPILKAAGYIPAGFHAFRRFRITRLRECKVPEDIVRFWIGHSSNNITDGYSGLSADVEFRRKLALEIGSGFEIPVSEPARCTKMYETDLEVVAA